MFDSVGNDAMQMLGPPQEASPGRSPGTAAWPVPLRNSAPRRPSAIAVVDPSPIAALSNNTPLRRRSMMSASELDPTQFISHNGLIELNRVDTTTSRGHSGAAVSGGSEGAQDDTTGLQSTGLWDDTAARAHIPAEPKMPRSYLLASGPLRHQSTLLDRGARDWNEEFQALWEVECRPPWSMEGRRQLEKLLRDFDATAKQLTLAVLCDAETIGGKNVPMGVRAAMSGSSRMGTDHPSQQRRRAGIRPVAQFPGCYRQGNLLIRRWRNPDIGKAVQRTFRSMFEARVPQLFFPLTATHSYMGVVVSVQALLPLADSATLTPRVLATSPSRRAATLGAAAPSPPTAVEAGQQVEASIVYRGDGVADATQTRAAHHYTVRLLEALNLAPHDRGHQWKYLGLEILEGLDGRYYTTNAVGLLPPLFPSHSAPTAHFRMEHLIQYAEPAHYMSSATLERFEEPISDLLSALPELLERGDKAGMSTALLFRPNNVPTGVDKRQQRLVDMLHDRSISIALLGRVLTRWINAAAQQYDIAEDAEALDGVTMCLCVEMIARTIKTVIAEKASQDEASSVDTDYATGYLTRAVASMVRKNGHQQAGTQPSSLRTNHQTSTSSENKSHSVDALANSRFEDALLPLLTAKFEMSGMEEMDHIRRAFETQHVPITKRLCDLLGLTMHRGVVVAIACRAHNHNFSPILSVASELKFSRWIMNEALDGDCPQEVLVSFVLPRRAAIHCRSGAYDKALSLQRKITSRRLRLGSRNFLYFDSLIDTALVATKCNEFEVADALYQRVLEGCESNGGGGAGSGLMSSARWADGGGFNLHVSRLKILLQIAWAGLKSTQELFREARKRYNDALEMSRNLLNDAVPASMGLACFNGLIDIAARCPAVQDAIALQSQVSLSVMRMRPSPPGLDTLRSLSTVLFEGKHFHAAAETLRDGMEVCTAVYGPVSEEMAVVTNYLSYVYYRWSIPKYGPTCRELLSSCQMIMRDLRGVNSAAFLTATNNLIRLQVELGEFTRASSQLHRLLRQQSSVKAVPGLSRQHPVYHALQATRELLCERYREKAVYVLQNAWRGYQEKLLLQDIVQESVVTIQACGRGYMGRWRLQMLGRHGANPISAARSLAYNSSSPRAQRGGAGSSMALSPQASFYRGASPSMSMRGAAAAAAHRIPGSRDENPFVFGFSRHLLTTSAEVNKDARDWNEEYQAMVDVIKSSLDPSATQRYEKRASAVRDAFRTTVDRYVRIIEDTPSRAPKAAGSSTAYRFDNVVITQWPGDAVTPFAQEEAMRRVIAAGFPGITAPLLETFSSVGSYTYVAQALIPLPRANVEYLRQEDLRGVVLTRKGALHHTILEVLVDQITATEPPDVRLSGPSGGNSNTISGMFHMDESMFRDDLSGNSALNDSTRVQSKGIEVIHGYDDRWYVTNALGLFPTCLWTMEKFDNVPKSSAMVLPWLPEARPSIFETCRALVSKGRVDEALSAAEEWGVATQRKHGGASVDPKRKLDSVLGTTLKAYVAGAIGRTKDAYQQLRTVALSLEQRDACSMRAAEAWWAAGRILLSGGQEFLDSAAIFSRALQLLVKSPNHRVRTLTLLQFLESLLKSHMGNHDAGNAPLPHLEESAVPTETMLRWVGLSAHACCNRKKPSAALQSSKDPSFQSTTFTSAPPLIAYEVCRRASRYYETRNMLDEAITFSSEARRLCGGIYGECSVNYAQDLDRSAVLHHQRGDLSKDDAQRSMELLQASVDVMKRAAPDSVELGVLHNRIGAVQLHRYALGSAAQHFRQALSMLSMRLHHDHREMIALRKNTKLLEIQLHIRSAVRIQSYVRGWLARHRAQEALRFSDPPEFRRHIAAKFEKRVNLLVHFETSQRLTAVDDELVEFMAMEKEERRMRERARRSGVRRGMQAKFEGLMSQRSLRLRADVLLPHEMLLRAGREWLAITNVIPTYRTFLFELHLLQVRQVLKERQLWLQQLRLASFQHFEAVQRRGIEGVHTTWTTRLLVWHEARVRRELVADALIAKRELGEEFADGANHLLGYTTRLKVAVSKLQEAEAKLDDVEHSTEPQDRMDLHEQEAAERDRLSRLLIESPPSREPTPLIRVEGDTGEDEGRSPSVMDHSQRPLISPLATAEQPSLASESSGGIASKLHAATSCHSEWSHGNVPLLMVTSPVHSRQEAGLMEVEDLPDVVEEGEHHVHPQQPREYKNSASSMDALGSGSRVRGSTGSSVEGETSPLSNRDHSPIIGGEQPSAAAALQSGMGSAVFRANDSFASSLPLPPPMASSQHGRSPIDQGLASQRGRRTPRHSLVFSSSIDLVGNHSGRHHPNTSGFLQESDTFESTLTDTVVLASSGTADPQPHRHQQKTPTEAVPATTSRSRPNLTLETSRPSPLAPALRPPTLEVTVPPPAVQPMPMMGVGTPFQQGEGVRAEFNGSMRSMRSSRSPMNQSTHTQAQPGSITSGGLEPVAVAGSVGSGTFGAAPMMRSPTDAALLGRPPTPLQPSSSEATSRRTSTSTGAPHPSSGGADSRRQSAASSLLVHQDAVSTTSRRHKGEGLQLATALDSGEGDRAHLSPVNYEPTSPPNYTLPEFLATNDDEVSKAAAPLSSNAHRGQHQPTPPATSNPLVPVPGHPHQGLQSVRPKLSAKNLAKLHKALSLDSSGRVTDGGQASFLMCTAMPTMTGEGHDDDEGGVSPLGEPLQSAGAVLAAIGSSGSSSSVMSLAPEGGGPALTPVRKPAADSAGFTSTAAVRQHNVTHLLSARGGALLDDVSDVLTSSINSAAVSFGGNNSSRSPRGVFQHHAPALGKNSYGPLGNSNRSDSPLMEQLESAQRRTIEHQERTVRSALREFMHASYGTLLKEHLLVAQQQSSDGLNDEPSLLLPPPASTNNKHQTKQSKMLIASPKPAKPAGSPRNQTSSAGLRLAADSPKSAVRRHASAGPSTTQAAVAAPSLTTTPRRGSVTRQLPTKPSSVKSRQQQVSALIADEVLVRSQLQGVEEGEWSLLLALQPAGNSRLKRIGSLGSVASLGGDGRPPRQPSFTSLKRRGSTPRNTNSTTHLPTSILPTVTTPNNSKQELLRSVEQLLQRRASK